MDSLSSINSKQTDSPFSLLSLPSDILGKIFKETFTIVELAKQRHLCRFAKQAIDLAIDHEWTSVRKECESKTEDQLDDSLLNKSLNLINCIYSRKATRNVEQAKEAAYKEFPVEQKEFSFNNFWRSSALARIVTKEIYQNLASAKKTCKGIGEYRNFLFKTKSLLLIGDKELKMNEIDAAIKTASELFGFFKYQACSVILGKILEEKDFEKAKEMAFLFKGMNLDGHDGEYTRVAQALAFIVSVQAETDLKGAKETAAMIKALEPFYPHHEGFYYAEALSEIIKIEAKSDLDAAWKTFALFPEKTVSPEQFRSQAILYLIQAYLSLGDTDRASNLVTQIEYENVAQEARTSIQNYYNLKK